ncbi:putative uncharacterized protein [Clostridium sp. CAG:967]|nr:putative uncharacterized protein [Clostridium sp. CAG:967]
MNNNIELNPFEIKAEIAKLMTNLEGIKDFESYEVHYRTLDAQTDKNVIIKLLFKEINSSSNPELLKYLLVRYCPMKELVEKLWGLIKNNMTSNQAKIFALDLLRDIDTDWNYDSCSEYLDNPDELVNADTKKILDTAIANPEVQIDFLDFLNSLPDNDKVILLNSLAEDYSKDELANMLVPVFLSQSATEAGKTALEILGNSKSQLAYHALNSSLDFVDESLVPSVKKNLSVLKLSGIREDNSIEFYKEILKDSKPYKFCITYPDGHGNQAVIVSRINKSGKVQFVAIVIDDYKGIRDCFGFNEISKFECNTIIERFYRGQRALDLSPEILKAFLVKAEKLSGHNMPYEYVCWKNLLIDIEAEDLNRIINLISKDAKKLDSSEFENILQADFTDYWFLNSDYSDEFEDFIKLLNETEPKDYEKIIDENIDKIFYPAEKHVWYERILNVSILKYLAGSENMASALYSLYKDEELKLELLKNIVRKSIYEYYTAQKDADRVYEIEKMWVK